jgi:transposase
MDKKKSSRRVYDADFRSDVLKMVFSGRSVVEVAASLGIRENLIHKWKSRYKETTEVSALKSSGTETPVVSVEEYERMKARLREVEQERDILKKALGIFSRII